MNMKEVAARRGRMKQAKVELYDLMGLMARFLDDKEKEIFNLLSRDPEVMERRPGSIAFANQLDLFALQQLGGD